MKGSVQYKKNNKKWYPVIYDSDINKHKWGTGFTNKRDAESELRSLLSNYDDGSVVFGKQDTLGELYKSFEEIIMPEIYKSEGQIRTVNGNFSKHILPIFGNVRVDRITKMDIQKFFFNMRVDKTIIKDGKKVRIKVEPAPATKRKVLSNLSSFFNACLDWGMVAENPCNNVKLKSPSMQIPDTWTQEELSYFLSLDFVKNSEYYIAFLLLSTTGISRSELCGLQWKDFHGTYFILDRGKDAYDNLTDMKNNFRHRKIELMDFVVGELNSHRNVQKLISHAKFDSMQIVSSVITNYENEPIRADMITKKFRRFIEKNNKENDYKLTLIPLKNLRHTFASLLIYDDVNIKVVSDLLGHARVSTTQNFYQGTAQQTMHRSAVVNIENKLFKTSLENPLENKETVEHRKCYNR